MIETVSGILSKYPKLLRDFNILLVDHDRRIECASHVQEISLITVITSSGARIHAIPGARNMLDSSDHIVNTEGLRGIFYSSNDRWKDLLGLKSEWAGCTQELVQTVRQTKEHFRLSF